MVFFSHGFPPGLHFIFLCHNSRPWRKGIGSKKHYFPAEKQLRISLILLGYVNLFPYSDSHTLTCDMLHTFYIPFWFYWGNLKRVVCNPQSTFQSSALYKPAVKLPLLLLCRFTLGGVHFSTTVFLSRGCTLKSLKEIS
jgi:hypothetical protein